MKLAGSVLCLALCAAIGAGSPIPEARAAPPETGIVLAQAEQGKPQKRRGGIFRFLFGKRQREAPPPIIVAPSPREQARPRRQREAAQPKKRKERRKRPAAAAAPREVAAVEKAPDAKRVLVLGDFMAGALSKGLTEAYSENAKVVVIDASSGSSGLVRSDFYNWPGELPGLVEKEKPDAILVLVGANDRQDMETATGGTEFGTDAWKIAYMVRVSAFADMLKATTKPVLWAGLAPVRQSAMSRDYSTFNGIVREQLESKGLRFIETWNGFADEEGKFVSSGPDVSGQPVQLRVGDGLNFTRAGQRKLAYFVERELNDILRGKAPQVAAAAASAIPVEPGEPTPQIGPMVPIEALTLGGGEALSTGALEQADAAANAIVERIAGNGAASPPPGRADNYVWPPPVIAPAATPASAAGAAAAPVGPRASR